MTGRPDSGRIITLVTGGPEETRRAGEALGAMLAMDDVVLITGELGAGKTTFVQGVCRGLGVDERLPVRSPTFTFIHEYQGRIPIRHVDLYRAETGEDIETIGMFDPARPCVTLIEWAEKLPAWGRRENAVNVRIEEVSETRRRIAITIDRERGAVMGEKRSG